MFGVVVVEVVCTYVLVYVREAAHWECRPVCIAGSCCTGASGAVETHTRRRCKAERREREEKEAGVDAVII
jgi:hypothetical protein